MTMFFRTALIAFTAATSAAAADAPPLTGMWGAGDALLALDMQGGRLQVGCTFALLSPVRPDAAGHFTTDAQVESLSAKLPEEDEGDGKPVAGRLSGHLANGGIDLTLTIQGQPARQIRVIAGQRGKPARCL